MHLFENITQLISNNPYFFGTFFFFLGTIIASFFNVVILRYPKVNNYEDSLEIKEWLEDKKISVPNELNQFEKISLSFPSSHCYSCNTPLKWYHNIPIFSYLFLRGQCGYCGVHISYQYPIIEFIGGLIMLFCYYFFIPMGLLYFIVATILFMSLFVSATIDFKSFLLPSGITYFLLWFGLGLSLFDISLMNLSIKDSIAGALTGYLICRIIADIGKLIKGYPVMGEGDLILLSMLGVFVGIKGAIFTFFAAPFIGIITSIIFKLMRKDTSLVPYGPSLILTACYYILFSHSLPQVIVDILNLLPQF